LVDESLQLGRGLHARDRTAHLGNTEKLLTISCWLHHNVASVLDGATVPLPPGTLEPRHSSVEAQQHEPPETHVSNDGIEAYP
ncbi:MAG: hypothetical protein AABX62_02415, partial [Thermoproteota archaeon]